MELFRPSDTLSRLLPRESLVLAFLMGFWLQCEECRLVIKQKIWKQENIKIMSL